MLKKARGLREKHEIILRIWLLFSEFSLKITNVIFKRPWKHFIFYTFTSFSSLTLENVKKLVVCWKCSASFLPPSSKSLKTFKKILNVSWKSSLTFNFTVYRKTFPFQSLNSFSSFIFQIIKLIKPDVFVISSNLLF